jgi:hypothetical protein
MRRWHCTLGSSIQTYLLPYCVPLKLNWSPGLDGKKGEVKGQDVTGTQGQGTRMESCAFNNQARRVSVLYRAAAAENAIEPSCK